MKSVTKPGLLALAALSLTVGCANTGTTAAKSRERHPQVTVSTGPRSAGRDTPAQPESQRLLTRKALTASNNPTTAAGRGEPSLDDFLRPAAWIDIDGHPGKPAEQEGRPLAHWRVDEPVKPAPTFAVQAYAPLLGDPRDFSGVLSTVDSVNGAKISYSIQAEEGAFEAWRSYSLLRPGAEFTIRNRTTGDVVSEIAPLTPGTYMLAAAVKNLQTGHESLAMTYFAVAEGP